MYDMDNFCERIRDVSKSNSVSCTAAALSSTASINSDDLLSMRMKQDAVFKLFEEVLGIYKAEQLLFSFNGGKDCTVLLDLLTKFYKERCITNLRIPVLYIQSDDAFVEVDEFVDECALHYNVQLIRYKGSLKEALARVCADMSHIKAVFLGCRRTDPYCKDLPAMHPTDNGWPSLMRINPILDWSYHDIWNYIRANNVPYSALYDRGYTSLGHKSNTVQNPHLMYYGDEERRYRPAYDLKDGDHERAGRL